MSRVLTTFMLTAALFAVQAQYTDQVQRANVSGTDSSSGKCTIEVRVDMTAEVDLYGDSGRLRTLAGQPATWTRFECSGPMPYRMSDFRFRGIDGRGNVRLVQDPRNNNSTAVIRVEDPRSGAEGYTFEVEWTGGSGGSPTGGFSSAPTYGNTTTGYPSPGRMGRGARGRTAMSSEAAIDLCRSEVRTRAERDFGLRTIDVTSASVDAAQGRREWVTGTFNERSGFRRSGQYRFSCAVDYDAGQVRSLEIQRPDGTALQPGASGTSGTYSTTPSYTQSGYDQNQVFRACQDAVIARTNRDGYENVRFGATQIDTRRSEWVSGSITAARGPVTDTFDFGCSMDFRNARVRNVELTRR